MDETPPVHTVVLAVTGGIAAYKVCEVVRRLRDHDIAVRVAMTRAATQLVGPTTFAALSGHRVITSLWEDPHPQQIAHVRWAESCDLFCVAPATAGFIAKMAHGIADDFASTLHLAVAAPVLVAPAMEDDMFRSPAVQRNLDTLRQRGVQVLGPGTGALASGRHGPGRMLEPCHIVEAVLRTLESGPPQRWLEGKRVVVTAGPTWEAIDPIRVLTNRSSGRMGYAMADCARDLGAKVVLVTGPTALMPPWGVVVASVETAEQMASATLERAAEADIVVMTAAVADFTPGEVAADKLKKSGAGSLRLNLVPTTDILAELGRREGGPLLVGFAAETRALEESARGKLADKRCDLMVANRVGEPELGMGASRNAVIVLDRLEGRVELGPAPKRQISTGIWNAVRDYRRRAGIADG